MDTGTTTQSSVDITPILNNQNDSIFLQKTECILLVAILVFLGFNKVFGRFK